MSYTIDASHSQIEFSVKHMMVSTVRGRFKTFSGEVEIDEATPANSKVNVTIDISSIDTGDANRDGHLRSADFFESDTHPTAAFVSKSVEAKGEGEYLVIGDLTIHGVTKELPLTITHEGQAISMQGKKVLAFSANTTISRKEFGLEWNVALESGGFLVSDQVKLNLDIEAVETATVAA